MCEVQSTERAFAALTHQGTVIAWDDPHYGGCMKEAVGELSDLVVAKGVCAVVVLPMAFRSKADS